MICDKCDPAGHIGGLEREFLQRMYEERTKELNRAYTVLGEVASGRRRPDRFMGEHIARITRDLDAISNLQIVINM